MTPASLYRSPLFVRLAEASGGAAWTALHALLSVAEEDGTPVLTETRRRQALACLPPRAQRSAQRALVVAGLVVAVVGGWAVRESPDAPLPAVTTVTRPDEDEASARRTHLATLRQQRKRARERGEVEANDHVPAASVTHSRDPVTLHPDAVTLPVTPSVTGPVTLPASRASEEILPLNSPSLSPPFVQKEEERGEEILPPTREASTPAEAVTDPVTLSVTDRAVTLWCATFDAPPSAVATRDIAAVEHVVAAGATWSELRAAIAYVAGKAWYREGDPADPRYRLAVVCGTRWEEHREKGLARPQSGRRAVAPPAPSAPVAPVPEARPLPRQPPARLPAPMSQAAADGARAALDHLLAGVGRVVPPVRRQGETG